MRRGGGKVKRKPIEVSGRCVIYMYMYAMLVGG